MRTLFIGALGGLMLALASCAKDNATSPQGDTGTMQVNMVDAPAGYDQVNVVVDSVQAHIATADSMSGWTTLSTTPATYNLLAYSNGNFAVLGSAVLPVGHYTQMRLYVGSGSNVVVDGSTKPLNIPSGVQSGVKLNIDATIVADATYTLTLDFDANQSVVTSGNPVNPTYSLKPVIRTSTAYTTGFIAGAVLPLSAKPNIWAYGGTSDTLSTTTDLAGAFKFVYVSPGTYTVSIASTDTAYVDSTIVGVSVNAFATANLGTIVLRHK
ncbi:MAG: DUF4382 domain-containing protein [Bacteroidota bacterium]